MPIDVLMPALSPTMEEGKLAKWLKKEGDAVKSGDVIAEIETDKATMEVEAVDEGTLGKILVPEGTENVKVNTPIALMLGEGESARRPSLQRQAGSRHWPAKSNQPMAAATGDKKAEPRADAAPAAAPKRAAGGRSRHPGRHRDGHHAVREALRDAMAEEMRRDADVFVMGEEVAEYQGAYKVTQGLLEEFGARRVVDTPITEYGFAGSASARRSPG